MKQVISLILVVMAFAAFGKNIDNGHPKYTPANVFYHTLGDGSLANDTLTINGINTWGPFPLARDGNSAAASYIVLHAPISCVADGDTLAIDYQLLPTYSLSDTTATWTALDTVTDAGGMSGVDTIDNTGAVAIVYRIKDIEGSASQLLKRLRVMLRENIYRLTK